MAAFIVISADERLHHLVDGIKKCRPLNSAVSAKISTGKITKKDQRYIYEYTIQGEGCTGDGEKTFCDLLSNQLSAFRLAYTIPKDQLVNIFFLENPLTEQDLEKSNCWMKEFDKLFHAGKGSDTNFCLFRVVFTYNLDKPSDVTAQIDSAVLKKLLEDHKKAVSCSQEAGTEPTLERYLFYMDNQKSDAAALCLSKDDHDLKMPRILIDFMMLASNSVDNYKINSAINPPLVSTRCFSVGYAESMYYYPDVERYYIHADNRDIHHRFLISEDEISEDEGKKTMDVETYPFGLRNRKHRLGKFYEDVPFTDSISSHPASADLKIDNCIVALRELLEKERKTEYENFNNSAEVVDRKKCIVNYESQINSAQQGEDETPEDFNERVNQLKASKEKVSKELQQIIDSFQPECPEYIDRNDIYNEVCNTEDKDKEQLLADLSCRYRTLVDFAKSKIFSDFVKQEYGTPSSDGVAGDCSTEINVGNTDELRNNSGCLFSWLHFLKKNEPEKADATNEKNAQSRTAALGRITSIIKEQLELKKCYVAFKKDVSSVESVYEDEKKYCEEFKLTTHTSSYFSLIDLEQLRAKQREASERRIQESIDAWRTDGAEPRKEQLIEKIKKSAKDYTKRYSFIDWNNPFSFVKEICENTNLPDICNRLQALSAPIVNYNLTTTTAANNVVRYFLSDRPQFANEMKRIRAKLDNGNVLTAMTSTHIASKICMFQFLPMDEGVLENLVDLQKEDGDGIDLTGLTGCLPQNDDVPIVLKDDSKADNDSDAIDWGEE